MRTTLAKLGTCAAVAFLLLTGCTSGEDQSEQEEIALDPVVMAMDQASVDPSQIEYPLDPYWPDDDHVHLMERAKAVVEQECMRRFGLELPLPTDYPPAKPFPVWDWYGLWDEGTARELGYGSPAFGSGRPFASHVVEAGAEWVPVFLGEVETFNGESVPEGGCQGESGRVLGKDSTDGKSYLVESLQRDAGARARQHSAVEALIDDWAMCLSDAGWEFEDPSNPFHHFEGGDPAEEVEAALADIRCKQETGLLRAWVAADVAYQHRLVEENAQALRELSGWLEELRDNANRIIAGER